MYSKLIQAKQLLVNYIAKTDFDEEAIEYLIDTIDYLVVGKIPLNEEILDIFLGDIMVTGTYHRGETFLQVASIVEEIIREIKCTTLQ